MKDTTMEASRASADPATPTDLTETWRIVYAAVGPWEVRVEEDLSPDSLGVRVRRCLPDEDGPAAGALRPLGLDNGGWFTKLVSRSELRQLGLALTRAADTMNAAQPPVRAPR